MHMRSSRRGAVVRLSAAPAPGAARVIRRWCLEQVVILDNRAHATMKFTVADVAAIAELGREGLQQPIPTCGGQRCRQPKYFAELRVGEVDRHGAFPCGASRAAR